MTSISSNNKWLVATVKLIFEESPNVKSIYFRMPQPLYHLAGQHYELRLTAENGYQAARLYSAATAGDGSSLLHLTIQDVEDGEVSPYVTQQLKVGDQVEIRGPFGKYFVWSADIERPTLLIGGGSGIVPMHAMFEAHEHSKSLIPLLVLYSARTFDDILFKDSFLAASNVAITLTKDWPEVWEGSKGRITHELLQLTLEGLSTPIVYICGMSSFVDAIGNVLIELGVPSADIRTERFG